MKGSCTDTVLQYLIDQNRPYSATDIFNNLHKEHGKTAVTKSLDDLTAAGKVREKINGKQKVYAAKQDDLPAMSEAEIKSMDADIRRLNDEVKSAESALKAQDAELKSLSSSMTTAEASEMLQQLTEECATLEERYTALAGQTGPTITPEEKVKVIESKSTMVKAWRKRKRMTMDILNAVLEGYPKPKKVLFEEVGIETDEMFNIAPPES